MLVLHATGVRRVRRAGQEHQCWHTAHGSSGLLLFIPCSLWVTPVMPGTCEEPVMSSVFSLIQGTRQTTPPPAPHKRLSPILSTMPEIKEQCNLPVLAAVPLPSP